MTCIKELGQDFGSGLYQREVEYLISHEWATTTKDILFRRTKIGLIMPPKDIATLENFIRLKRAKSGKNENDARQSKTASRSKSGVI